MFGLDEYLLGFGELPTLDSALSLDLHLGVMILLLPLVEHVVSLVDDVDGDIGLLSEDALDVDLVADFVAYLIGDAVEQILHLGVGLVDVARDGPDQLETVEQRGECLLDHWQVTSRQVLELALQSCQELHEVLSLGVQLLEVRILTLKELHAPAVGTSAALVLNVLHNLLNK